MALFHFPTPYKDECLTGILGRLAKRTLCNSPKRLSDDLFGDSNVTATIDLPSHLIALQQNVSHIFPYSVDQIIEHFTLYNFYSPFLQDWKRIKILESMKGTNGSTIHTRAGINASNISKNRFPKFCPICFMEDVQEYGEGYFHLAHQIPDIICVRHNCLLLEYMPEIREIHGRQFLFLPEEPRSHWTHKSNKYPRLLDISTTLSMILHRQMDFDINNIDYEEKIFNTSYVRGRKIDQMKFSEDFMAYYGSDLLRLLLPKQRASDHGRWIAEILRRPLHIFHPIRHIMINEFIKTLSSSCAESKPPFGNGPWKCFNKASDHFGLAVITRMTTHVDSKSGHQIGIFECECGMIYSMSFTSSMANSIEETIRIKVWGDRWMQRLRQEIKSGKSFRKIAFLLGTTASTVSDYSKPSSPLLDNTMEIETLRKTKRKEWDKLLNKFKNQRVKKARESSPKTYAWLYRNDSEWLVIINKLNSFKNTDVELRLDWGKLDEKIISLLTQCLTKLKKENFRGRITKTLLSTMINHQHYIIGKNIRHLPKSEKFLTENIESVESAQIRRIHVAAKHLKNVYKVVPRWKLMRKAGLKENLKQKITSEIERVLKTA
jgi:hypothetical protein